MSTKQRSRAWQYFSDVNEKSVTSCLLCGQKLSVKNKSTCSLIRHLTKKHQDTVLKRKLKKKSTALLKNTVYIIEPTNGTSSSSDLNDVCTDTDYAIKVQSADSECNFNTEPTRYAYSTTTFNIEDMSQLFLSAEHMLQGGYHHATLRRLQEPNTTIEPHNLMYPVFLLEDDDARQEVSSMPNVFRYGINHLIPVLSDLMDKGLKSILIFGIIETLPKDPTGSHADSSDNPVMRALPKLREALPDLLIACDVCLCPYTSHGHCGLLTSTGAIDHAASVKRIAEVALAYAMAGAQVVAPSDMMDNRIKAIKDALVAAKLQNQVSVLSYSCKFASSMYGPFRDTMKSSPMAGDRKCYQLPPGSAALAARAAARDVAEGADFLMVKPGLPYLDIVRQTKNQFPHHPLFIYQVSGEYAMISRSGDSKDVQTNLMEILTCMRRAGADCIITYFAPLILSIISGKN